MFIVMDIVSWLIFYKFTQQSLSAHIILKVRDIQPTAVTTITYRLERVEDLLGGTLAQILPGGHKSISDSALKPKKEV